MRARWAVSVVVLATACGNPGGSGDPDAQGSGSDADSNMGDAGDGWKMLIQRQWSVNAGLEEYDCRHQLVTEDTYITGFRALAPLAAHHTSLTVGPASLTPPANSAVHHRSALRRSHPLAHHCLAIAPPRHDPYL